MAEPVGTTKPFEITTAGFQLPLSSGLLATYGWLSFLGVDDDVVTDYCAKASERLIEQFEIKPLLNEFICALIEPLQELEFVFNDLFTLRRLEVATGDQLDGLGDIVGILRQGLSDTDYRQAIRFQIGINESSGEAESLIDLTFFLTGASVVLLSEVFPAEVHIFTDGNLVSNNTVRALEQSASAGVKIILTSSYGSLIPFAFEPDAGTIDPPGIIPEGFSEPNYAPDAGKGGQLAEAFT